MTTGPKGARNLFHHEQWFKDMFEYLDAQHRIEISRPNPHLASIAMHQPNPGIRKYGKPGDVTLKGHPAVEPDVVPDRGLNEVPAADIKDVPVTVLLEHEEKAPRPKITDSVEQAVERRLQHARAVITQCVYGNRYTSCQISCLISENALATNRR